MQDNAIYSKPVDQLLAQKAKFAGRPVRAEGNLIHGSLMKREQPCEYRFSIAKNGAELPVRFAQCVVPDTFRDVPDLDVGVTVEGELQSDDTFEATSVLAKCPSKYEMKQRKDHGEQMPHGPLASAAQRARCRRLGSGSASRKVPAAGNHDTVPDLRHMMRSICKPLLIVAFLGTVVAVPALAQHLELPARLRRVEGQQGRRGPRPRRLSEWQAVPRRIELRQGH